MGAKKYAYVNYKMLVWARSETPFGTTSDVANHISGFRSEVIDKWERGEELPSITEAKKLANLYKVPFATFYLSNPPEKKTKAYISYGEMCSTLSIKGKHISNIERAVMFI